MGSSTRTTTDNNPPAWARPAFELAGADAMRLYEDGYGGNTYLGSTVAPLSDTTMAGVNALNSAGANWDTGGTRDIYGGLGAAAADDPYAGLMRGVSDQIGGQNWNVNTNGMTGQANDLFGGIASGQQGINTGGMYGQVFNEAQSPSAADQYLTASARGDYLAEGNPYYRQRLEGELADTAAQTRSLMSGAGRYGSDVSNRLLTDRLGQQRTAALENDWNRERGLQMQSVGMIDQARQGNATTQLAAAGGLSGVQGQNLQNRMSAGGQMMDATYNRANFDAGNLDRQMQGYQTQGSLLGQAGNQSLGALDRSFGAADAMYGIDQQNFQNSIEGANAQLRAGGMMDDQSQANLQDEINRFYALDNQDWTRLSMLESAAAGAAGPYGQQLSTSRTSNPMAALGAVGSLFGGK
jgi:hypothetical protein